MNGEVVLLVALGLVAWTGYWAVSGLRKRKGAAARYEKMLPICAAHGGVPGPVDLPGIANFSALGRIAGFTNQFTNAADFTTREGGRRMFFTLATARFPGAGMPLVAVTRKGLPGFPMFGINRIEVESIAFTQRFTVTTMDRRLGFMLLDLPMIQWILDCGEVNFATLGDGVVAFVYRGDEGGPVFKPGEPSPVRGDGSELELLYRFVEGFGPRIPAGPKDQLAAPSQ
jgi:hypothetical protein